MLKSYNRLSRLRGERACARVSSSSDTELTVTARVDVFGIALRSAAVVAVLAMLAVFASSARAATTIRMSYFAGNDKMQSIVDRFEKANPDIKVQLQRPPLGTYESLLLTQLRSGNAPDVFFSTPGTGTVAAVQVLARAGYLAPLPSLQKNVLPLSKPVLSYKGKLYASPLIVGVNTAHYNVDAFRQMGLKVPKTFDQVLRLCRTVRRAGKSMFFLPASDRTVTSLILALLAVQEVYSTDPKWNVKRTLGKVKFAGNPNWERALRNFRSMGNAGCFNDNAIGVTLAAAPSVWARGDSLGFIANIGFGRFIMSATPNVKLSTFAFPATRAANTRVLLVPANNLAVNAKASNRAAAIKLVEWFARPDEQRFWAKDQGGTLSPIAYMQGKSLPTLYKPLSSYFKSKKTILNPDYKAKPAFFLSRAAGAQGLLTGKMSINDVLRDFDRSWRD